LVLAGDGTEPVLTEIRQAADYLGVPYTVRITSAQPGSLAASELSSADHGFYQGVILTTGALAYFNGVQWTSGLSAAEWQNLWDYEAKFQVRQTVWYTLPTADYGYGPGAAVDTTTTPISASLTTSGQALWSDVNASNPVVISKAFTYLAAAAGSGTTVLLADSAGHALALVRS